MDPYDEYNFRTWYKNWAQRTGLNPDPILPRKDLNTWDV